MDIVCKVNGKYQVVDYNELSYETANKMNSDGRLVYNAANIGEHIFSIKFLQHMCEYETLKYHVVKKKISYVNLKGKTLKPDKPNGVIIQKFLSDAFPLAKKCAIWQVDREEEFLPVKNKDTAEACKEAFFNLHRKHVQKTGGSFLRRKLNGEERCEVSPLVSYAGEGLEEIVKGKIYQFPFCLGLEHEMVYIVYEIKVKNVEMTPNEYYMAYN